MQPTAETVARLEAEIRELRSALTQTQEALRNQSDSLGGRDREVGQSETFAASVLDQTQDAIVVCDPSGHIIRANQAADQLCDGNPLQKQFEVAFPLHHVAASTTGNVPSRDEPLSLVPPASAVPFLRDVEASLVRNDGLQVELSVSVRPMVDESGQPLGTLVTMTDITDRKHAEDSLRRAKEDWEQTFDAVPDLVAVLDNQHRVVRANRAMADRVGMTPEQCAGLLCYQLVHGTAAPPESCPHMQTCRDGKEHTAEVEDARRGEYFLVSTTPRFDDQGQVIGAVHVARDISDLKRRERRIDTLTRVYAVLSQVNEVIVRVRDADALFSEVCRIIAETGRFPLAWVGRRDGKRVVPVAFSGPAANMVHEIQVEVEGRLGAGPTGTCLREHRPVVNDDFTTNPAMAPWREQANRHGLRTSAAFPLYRQGQPIGTLTLYAADPNAFDADQVTLLASLSADISYALDAIDDERRRVLAEEALRKSADELARSNEDLEQFASVASHDLQEPLRTVTGFVDLLRKRYVQQLDAEANRFIEFVLEGTERMQTLIRDLLAYSRVSTRRREPVSVDVGELLDQVQTTLHEQIQEARAEITHGPLPTVRADASQLAQLFQNLIGNGMKFRGQSPPKVHVEAVRDGDFWHFSVRDNGIGIDAKHHEQIFEVFRRLHTREHYEGTGIGLAICKKIVDRHGGRIWVESEPGHGATFHFTLPA
ncbi:MAG: ATP-binding protein [Thermoguttaceae bacterium]